MFAALVVVALQCGLCVPAEAQPGRGRRGLPPDLVAARDFEDASQRTVRNFASGPLWRLASVSSSHSAAREQLLEPLLGGGFEPSVGFRLLYTDVLLSDLTALLDEGSAVQCAVSALSLAGFLATPGGLDLIELGYLDERSAVRYAAAVAHGDLLATVANGGGALNEAELRRGERALRTALEDERDPLVVDALVRAAGRAGSERSVDQAPRLRATAAACAGVSEYVRGLASRVRDHGTAPTRAELDAVLGAMGLAMNVILSPAAQLAPEIHRDRAIREAALMAGHGAALVGAAVESVGPLDTDAAAAAADVGVLVAVLAVASATENVLSLSTNIGPREDLRQSVSLWSEGRVPPLAVRRRVDGWVGPGGLLTLEPYNFTAE